MISICIHLHNPAAVLIRAITAVLLLVAPLLHGHTDPVVTAELGLVAGGEGEENLGLRVASVPSDSPYEATQRIAGSDDPSLHVYNPSH